MIRLEIAESNNTPHILFDIESNVFVIEGKSFPEDSKDFFMPVIEWLDKAIEIKLPKLVMHFNLFYLSSSSIISVKQILQRLVELQTLGSDASVIWSFDEDDDDIKKTGEDYQKLTKLSFEYRIND